MYRCFEDRVRSVIIAILLLSSSACSLLFEQAPAVDGGGNSVDASLRPDAGMERDAGMAIRIDRHVSADTEQLLTADAVDAVALKLDINDKGNEVTPSLNCVALEFRDIDVPQGARILEASIVFVSQEQHQESISVNLLIDESVPVAALQAVDNDIRDRVLDLPVAWTPGGWQVEASGPAQTTPSLVEQIQRNTCNQGWTSGQSLVFMIQPGTSPGRRTAYSLEGSQLKVQNDSLAPRLTIRYQVGGSTECL